LAFATPKFEILNRLLSANQQAGYIRSLAAAAGGVLDCMEFALAQTPSPKATGFWAGRLAVVIFRILKDPARTPAAAAGRIPHRSPGAAFPCFGCPGSPPLPCALTCRRAVPRFRGAGRGQGRFGLVLTSVSTLPWLGRWYEVKAESKASIGASSMGWGPGTPQRV
jgi:hypothetical protein